MSNSLISASEDINKNKNISYKKSSFILDFFLAGTAGTIGKTATAPFDRIKLLLQNQHNLSIVDKNIRINRLFKKFIKK